MGPFGARQSQHPLRHVDADHFGCSACGEIVGELPRPAAEVQHPATPYVGQERQQISMLHRPLPAGSESLEA
jgi:hypothetical protein